MSKLVSIKEAAKIIKRQAEIIDEQYEQLTAPTNRRMIMKNCNKCDQKSNGCAPSPDGKCPDNFPRGYDMAEKMIGDRKDITVSINESLDVNYTQQIEEAITKAIGSLGFARTVTESNKGESKFSYYRFVRTKDK